MINQCQNGPNRRAWLRTLGWQSRPVLRRIRRRLLRALLVACKWIGVGALIAAGAIIFLVFLANAMTDPLDTPEKAVKKPAGAHVVQPLRRMT